MYDSLKNKIIITLSKINLILTKYITKNYNHNSILVLTFFDVELKVLVSFCSNLKELTLSRSLNLLVGYTFGNILLVARRYILHVRTSISSRYNKSEVPSVSFFSMFL